jgi:hypothetical protein
MVRIKVVNLGNVLIAINSLDGVMRKTTVAEGSVEDRPVVVAAAEVLKRKELIVEVEGEKNILSKVHIHVMYIYKYIYDVHTHTHDFR